MPEVSFDHKRLFDLMRGAEVDLLLASTRHNLRYLTGGYYYPLYMWDAHTRGTQYLSFLAIPRDSLGDALFIGRPGESQLIEEAGLWLERCVESPGIGTQPAAAKAVEELKALGLENGRIAVELPSLPADAFRILVDGLPDASLVDAVPILDALRAVKRPEELAIIREATRRNLEAVAAVLTSGRDGETTAELAGRVSREFGKRELHFLYALVCAGPGFFRAPSPKRSWKRDSLLHIDAGGMLQGYIAEVCRTGYLGTPSALADGLLRGCRELEQAVLRVLRPGLLGGEVQRTGDTFLEGHPLGKHGKFIAHGIGLVHHENPVIELGSTHVLQPGMVLSLEMEFLHAEAGHAKIEDMVVVTEDGHELLGPDEGQWYVSHP
ncbi:MAG: aminopeptidase P family protein [Spirochaetales bacterium]|nr:aminopeptidase P family protein [Spirochaetales bacterium]